MVKDASAEEQTIARKIEDILTVLQPAKDRLVEMGYLPKVTADNQDGVIRLTLAVHTIGG